MQTRRSFLCAAGAALASEGLRLTDTSGEKVAITHRGTTLLEYRYSKERPKPYVHPLCRPDGKPVTRDGPKDHIHHRGLMVAWSEVNGIDFWGEDNPAPHGQIIHRSFERLQESPVAEIASVNEWVAGGKPLLIERRVIRVPVPSADGVWLAWTTELRAADQAVNLAAGQHVYNGLGIRVIEAMDGGSVLNSNGIDTIEKANGEPAAWCAFHGGGTGVAFFDHPRNPRHPNAFFVMNRPFGYMSAAPTSANRSAWAPASRFGSPGAFSHSWEVRDRMFWIAFTSPGLEEGMNRVLGVAILGTGDVSGEHINAFALHPNAEVRAILSRDRARAEAKARGYGLNGCRAYTDLDELLRSDDIDVVSVCTPHHLHVEQGVACAEAGKHVVVEKPVALDLPGLRRLDAAIRTHNVRSVVSFVLRWNPLFETIRAILADGTIGEVFFGEVDYLHGITQSYGLYPWLRQREFGGSALLTAGCHAVDALRWFLGKEAEEVFCFANWSKGNPLDYEYEPNSMTLIRFREGTVGKVATSIEYIAPYTFPIVLMGNGGTIRDNRLFTKRWPGQTGWAAIPTVLPDSGAVTHHPFIGQMAHFIDCIQTGTESHCNLADAVKTHEICIAAEISKNEGRPVRLPLP